MDRIANTVGHYDAFRMNGDLNKQLVLEKLEIASVEFNRNNEIYCEDANSLVRRVEADIVYIDPPYNKGMALDAIRIISDLSILDKSGTIVLETDEDEEIPENIGIFELNKQKKYIFRCIFQK